MPLPKIHCLASLAGLVGCLCAGPAGAQRESMSATTAPRVRVQSGTVEGRVDPATHVRVFRGIPYAAPPVGPLRWRPPQPVPRWRHVRPALEDGASCPRLPARSASDVGEPMEEDCLFLNVFAPAQGQVGSPRTARPVMVWFHGGGFVGGSARGYDGRALAHKGAVVVTLNYRLGPLGYLAHPGLAAESPDGSSGNYGLLDQMAALRWVKRNIGAFGGDSARITIFGESAGAFSVGALLASPLARGLFHGAILQSGTGLGYGILSADTARAFAHAGAIRLGVSGVDAAAVVSLRAVPVDRLLEAYRGSYSALKPFALWFAPSIDPWVLPHPLDQAIVRGTWNPVPVVVGSNSAEGWYFVPRACRASGVLAPAAPCLPADSGTARGSLALYDALLGPGGFGDTTGGLARAYPAGTPAEAQEQLYRLVGDMGFGAPARALARLISSHGGRAYLYHFTRESVDSAGRPVKALHTTEVPFTFGNVPDAWEPYSAYRGHAPYDVRLADAVSDYWVAFASTGDPNRARAANPWPHWPRYTPREDSHLELGEEIVARQGLRSRQYDALDRLAGADHEGRP